jgi:hypothetical protein
MMVPPVETIASPSFISWQSGHFPRANDLAGQFSGKTKVHD